MGKRPTTYADLEALPGNVVGELIAGELYASPRPTVAHSVAAFELGGETNAGQARVHAEPFEALALELALLWGE